MVGVFIVLWPAALTGFAFGVVKLIEWFTPEV